jgi:hypothetical protein
LPDHYFLSSLAVHPRPSVRIGRSRAIPDTGLMVDAFKLVFRTSMTPWTQDCVYFVVLTISDVGIGVERDPSKGGLGLEEEWFSPWSDVMSIQHGHLPEPIVRVEFATVGGQTTIRDIRIPPIEVPPFRGCYGPLLVEAILIAYQEQCRPPSVDQVLRALSEIHPR